MECAGMIGEAVGRTRFKSDGLAIMATLTVRINRSLRVLPVRHMLSLKRAMYEGLVAFYTFSAIERKQNACRLLVREAR